METVELNNKLGQRVERLTDKWFDNGNETYILINEIIEDILATHYGSLENVTLPIDIRGIVKEHKIEIVETDLNVDLGFRIDRVNGYLRRISPSGGGELFRIYVEADDSEYTKRYVLAHEFSHYILRKWGKIPEDESNNVEYCIDPMLPKHWKELMADVMAAFLMFPYKLLLNEMDLYTQEMREMKNYPIDAIQLLRTIGNRAQISSYHTFMCFQYIKYFLCYIYNKIDKDNELNRYIQKYKFLFK